MNGRFSALMLTAFLAVPAVAEDASLGVRAEGADPVMPQFSAADNRIQNPGFAGGMQGWSHFNLGTGDLYTEPDAGWRIRNDVGRGGGECAEYCSRKGLSTPMLATYPLLTEPGDDYTLSFYARSDSPDAELLVVGQTEQWARFPVSKFICPGKNGKDWQRYTITFQAPSDFLRICFGDHWNSRLPKADGQQIYLDDVQLISGKEAGDFRQPPIACRVETGRKNAVFLEGEPAAVTVSFRNVTTQEQHLQAALEVRDAFGRGYASNKPEILLPANGSRTVTVDLAAANIRGTSSLKISMNAGDFHATTYARVARLQVVHRPLPLRYLYHTEEQPDLTEIDWRIRLGYGGSLGFRMADHPELCAEYAKRGWKHIFCLAEGEHAPVQLFQQKMSDEDWWKYFEWIDGRIGRFPGLANWYKCMNEPNIPGRTWTPEEHVRIARHLREMLRKTAPQAWLLTPEPVSTGRSDRDWLDRFLAAGGKDVVDAIATHTYRARPEAPDLDADIRQLVELKKKYGLQDKPILFTEGEAFMNYTIPSRNCSPLTAFTDWRLGMLSDDIGPSETIAGAMMARTLLVCLKNAGEVKTYTTWYDDFESGRPWTTAGTVNYLFSRLGDAPFIAERLIGDQCKSYVFRQKNGEGVAVLWCYDLSVESRKKAAPEAVLSAGEKQLVLRDMNGNALQASCVNGEFRFPLSSFPVYLSGNGMTDADLIGILEQARVGKNGVQALELITRLSGAHQATLQVKNRLSRPVAGALNVRVDGHDAGTLPVALAAGAEAELPVMLPEAAEGIPEAKLESQFTDANGRGFTRTSDFRWLAIRPVRPNTPEENWWKDQKPLLLNNVKALVPYQGSWCGKEDLSAECYLGYTEDALFMHLEVKDDRAVSPENLKHFWIGDGVQMYFDLSGNCRDHPEQEGYDSNDTVFWAAQIGGAVQFVREVAPEWQVGFVQAGPVKAGSVKIRREGASTLYDIRIPKEEINPLALRPGTVFGMALLVNDADQTGVRKQGLTFTPQKTEPANHPAFWPQVILLGN